MGLKTFSGALKLYMSLQTAYCAVIINKLMCCSVPVVKSSLNGTLVI